MKQDSENRISAEDRRYLAALSKAAGNLSVYGQFVASGKSVYDNEGRFVLKAKNVCVAAQTADILNTLMDINFYALKGGR